MDKLSYMVYGENYAKFEGNRNCVKK